MDENMSRAQLREDNPKSNSDTASDLNLQLALADPVSPPSLQDEIDILRSTLRWLQDTFTRSDSTEERLKLSNSICLVSATLSLSPYFGD